MSLIPTSPGRRPERGVTLLEIVIAMAIIAVGLLGFFSLHMRSLQTATSAGTMSEALTVAQATLDMLLAKPFSADTDGKFSTSTVTVSNPVDNLSEVLDEVDSRGVVNPSGTTRVYDRSYNMQVDDSTTPPTLIYTVRVRYRAADGRCPSCTDSNLRSGFKAVTMSAVKSQAAY